MKTSHIINSLPLVADAIGRKFGIKVQIGGNEAYTNGKKINIPSLPLDADETVLNLARGYLDHEAAHLRITDSKLLKQANMSSVERDVWNILEDFMVEKRISEVYPGCKRNLLWLVKHLFVKKPVHIMEVKSPINIFNWLLLAVRSLAVPEIGKNRDQLAKAIDTGYPKLRHRLEPIVKSVPHKCVDTKTCLELAHEIMSVISSYSVKQSKCVQPSQPNAKNDATSKNKSDTGDCESEKEVPSNRAEDIMPEQPDRTLGDVLHSEQGLPELDLGKLAGELLQGASADSCGSLTVAIPNPKEIEALSPAEINEIRSASSALRTRISGLLQTSGSIRNRISHTGKVDGKRLAKLAVCNPKVFVKHGRRLGINTAIHILLDTSGSMGGEKILLACHACYAIATALNSITGVNMAVTGFPGKLVFTESNDDPTWQSVSPILKQSCHLHDRFRIAAEGGTPLAEALWWVLQQMSPLTMKRKIILILSDGAPDNEEEARNAIEANHTLGHEVYGIGIDSGSIARLLPERDCRSINNLNDLAPAMFEMLQNALLNPVRR